MTPNTLPPCDTSSTEVSSTPVHPLASSSAWPCVSCPRTKVTITWLQSIGPSSGSLTVTANGMESPKAKVPPSTGVVTVTDGAVLPTVMTVLAKPVLPLVSVTVSRAVY